MGMDVCGVKNRDAYFRNTVWWWHPLWTYCCKVAPGLKTIVKNGHTNDGDGLNEKDSLALANILEASVVSGQAATYAASFSAIQEETPDESCWLCNGTGQRDWSQTKTPNEIGCNACDSTGKKRPISTWYLFDVENVVEFIKFLRECGGFKIF